MPKLQAKEKLNLISQVEGSSARDCDRKLAQLSPESVRPKDKTRLIDEEITLVSFSAGSRFMNKIDRLKELTSHSNPEGQYERLFEQAIDALLEKIDPVKKEERRKRRKAAKLKTSPLPSRVKQNYQNNSPLTQPPTGKSLIHIHGKSAREELGVPVTVGKALFQNKQLNKAKHPPLPTSGVVTKTRHIPSSIKDRVWVRDQGRCQYRDRKTGRSCHSKIRLQMDHRYPYSLGGEHDFKNLRLLCANHNRYVARETLG